jgi:hypothetical protein
MKDAFRSPEMRQQYADRIRSGILDRCCVLCEKRDDEQYAHWKIVPNDFPYDLIAQVHHMIVPRRHVTEEFLSPEEREELVSIKKTLLHTYDYIIEASAGGKSIPEHFHLHLIQKKVM